MLLIYPNPRLRALRPEINASMTINLAKPPSTQRKSSKFLAPLRLCEISNPVVFIESPDRFQLGHFMTVVCRKLHASEATPPRGLFRIMNFLSIVALPIALLFVSACSTTRHWHDGGPTSPPVDISTIQDAVPRPEPRSKRGNSDHYSALGKHYYVRKSSRGFVQKGIASWYGTKFHRRRTANGERYDMYSMSAAHPSLPIPTYVRVTNLRNNRSVVVRINDRGPFVDNRIIDLSYVAAAKLGMLKKGTALVEVRAIDPHQYQAAASGNTRVIQQPEPSNRRHTEKSVVSVDHHKLSVSGEIIGLPKEITLTGTAQVKRQPQLYLQVGSFGVRSNAERLRQTLHQSMKPGVFIHEQTTNQQTLYRVRIGPIKSAEQVEHLTTYVRRFGIHAPVPVLE